MDKPKTASVEELAEWAVDQMLADPRVWGTHGCPDAHKHGLIVGHVWNALRIYSLGLGLPRSNDPIDSRPDEHDSVVHEVAPG
jgi:hypothetical protein